MAARADAPSPAAGRLPLWLLVVAVILLAANLRAAVNVIGPVLPEMRRELDLSGAGTGALTAMPTFCFAAFGSTGPLLSRRLGTSRVIVLAIAAMAAGQLVRALVPGAVAVFAGTAVALAAIAVANVLMPAVVARFFPGNVARMTAVYTVTLAAAGAAASAATLQVQDAAGSDWHLGIGMWASLSVVALLPWVVVSVNDHAPSQRLVVAHLALTRVARSVKAWVLAAFFGLQALQAYVVFSWYPTILSDSGMDLAAASAYVGIISVASMVGSMLVPNLLHRLRRPGVLVLALSACFIGGYAGTALAPLQATWLWTLLIGLGISFFPMGLFIVTQRAATEPGVLALSGFMQGLGYLVAGLGLLLFGALQGDSTHWEPALVALSVLILVQTVAAFVSVSVWHIEEELGLT
jgi:MFS transporter, CP family, cyanate transporter